MSGVEILLDSNRGVYIPQHFAEIVKSTISWKGYDSDDIDTLLEGPGTESYWMALDNVFESAVFVDAKGNYWHLWQDGDLFAYCRKLMTDREYEDFFGELPSD
jgi:hypothetical protein